MVFSNFTKKIIKEAVNFRLGKKKWNQDVLTYFAFEIYTLRYVWELEDFAPFFAFTLIAIGTSWRKEKENEEFRLIHGAF